VVTSTRGVFLGRLFNVDHTGGQHCSLAAIVGKRNAFALKSPWGSLFAAQIWIGSGRFRRRDGAIHHAAWGQTLKTKINEAPKWDAG
jgi:hypothetical protein